MEGTWSDASVPPRMPPKENSAYRASRCRSITAIVWQRRSSVARMSRSLPSGAPSARPEGSIRATCRSLQQRPGALLISVHDRIGAHIGERLDGERRIEAAARWEGRAADDEEVRDVPALAVAVHDRH